LLIDECLNYNLEESRSKEKNVEGGKVLGESEDTLCLGEGRKSII
jgi:hypothetical protein